MADSAFNMEMPYDQVVELVAEALRRAGCSPSTSLILAKNCVGAEIAGSESHGLFRLEGYLATLRSGWVDGMAQPKVSILSPAHIHVDAANGFAQTALAAARDALIARTRACGIAILTIGGSHHLAALWPDVAPFAEEGLIAISMVNSFACAIPVGAKSAILGTNPLAFAAPVPDGAPFVFDFATTSMSNGDVRVAAREGRRLQPGCGVDRHGSPTTDPNEILDGGALLPFGGHKGSAISLMIELLVAGLTGGKFSSEVDWSQHPGAATPHTGQVIIAIDPSVDGAGDWNSRCSQFIEMLRHAGMDTYPGLRRWRCRKRESVRVTADVARLLSLASQGAHD